MKNIGIYIHIPFCKQKCYYCDFISYANCNQFIDEYIRALMLEIENIYKEDIKIDTIYIGGGTPSYIDAEHIVNIISKIKEKFEVNKDAEITIEINPGTVEDEEKLQKYKQAGINRISIGLQACQNELLKEIGRIHTYEEFKSTYIQARKVGFENINVDLMIGLPNQTEKNVQDSLEKIIEINPEHISVYSLILEEDTILYNKVQNKELQLPSDELERKEYWLVKNTLEQNKYKQYEISNFSKEGYESKHNTNCWKQHEYLGIGYAAHSYLDGIRYSNTKPKDIKAYIKNCKALKFDINIEINETQTLEIQKREYMMLGLRTLDGVSIQEFKEKFIENPIYIFKKELKKLANQGLIEVDGDYIKLTTKGLDLANLVWEEFV